MPDEKRKEEPNRIILTDVEDKPMLILDPNGKIIWGERGPTKEKSGVEFLEFANVVVYLFDIMYSQQARLWGAQQEIFKLLKDMEEKIDARTKLIKLTH